MCTESLESEEMVYWRGKKAIFCTFPSLSLNSLLKKASSLLDKLATVIASYLRSTN